MAALAGCYICPGTGVPCRDGLEVHLVGHVPEGSYRVHVHYGSASADCTGDVVCGDAAPSAFSCDTTHPLHVSLGCDGLMITSDRSGIQSPTPSVDVTIEHADGTPLYARTIALRNDQPSGCNVGGCAHTEWLDL
jgi:hypothetical protein